MVKRALDQRIMDRYYFHFLMTLSFALRVFDYKNKKNASRIKSLAFFIHIQVTVDSKKLTTLL